MGLFGSLFTGVSSLFAQSQNTAIISNNIANISTTGFKRSEASFQSLVTSESRSAQFSPGTVSVNRIQRVDQQGSIQQTSSGTDASISGNGFFPVKRSSDFGQEFLYTRAGQFSEDSQGLLRNASGFILYAWPLDADGNLPANQGDLNSLVPADVAFLGGLTRPTTSAELAFNLDANEDEINTGSIVGGAQDGTTGFTGYPIPDTTQASFSRSVTVFDTLGSAQNVTLEFRKIDGPIAKVRSETTTVLDRDTAFGAINASTGDQFSISVGGTSVTYEVGSATGGTRVDTLGDLVNELNNNFNNGTDITASISPDGELLLKANDLSADITVTDITGSVLFGATQLNISGGPGPTQTFSPINLDGTVAQDTATNPYGFDTNATDPNNQADFPTLANSTTPNTEGWWELKVIHPDGSTISEGLLNFNGDGSLNASGDSSGDVDIELTNIDWGNGSSLQDINVDVERFSQFAGNFDVIFSDQNGAELGLRTGVELTRDGTVVARFSNGASADLYRVPLTTFANPNGLTEVSGTGYTESEESGEENLREVGTGGAGFIEPATLEASNVDLADEFARLIVSQRAFGASTRVINTVDEMTEDLLRLR